MTRSRPIALTTLALAGVALLGAAGASGSSLKIERLELSAGTKPYSDDVLTWTAAPGERNELTVTPTPRGIVLRDTGAPIAPAPGCGTEPDGAVVCRQHYLQLDAGDGDDVVTLSSPGHPWDVLRVQGGSGNDQITIEGAASLGSAYPVYGEDGIGGGPGDDLLRLGDAPMGASGDEGSDTLVGGAGVNGLDGGPGDDRLEGGGDDDVLQGGDGSDVLDAGAGDDELPGGASLAEYFASGHRSPDRLAGGPGDDALAGDFGDDVLDGGDGEDRVSYDSRLEPVTVDMRAGVGGVAGERDELVAVEHLTGGYGPDTLLGDDGPNRIDGGSTDRGTLPSYTRLENLLGTGDRIEGGGGDDVLSGGGSVGYPGNVRCGEGADLVTSSSRGDRIARDCEAIAVRGLLLRRRAPDPEAPETLPLELVRGLGPGAPCGAFLRLTDPASGSAVLATARVRVRRGATRRITLRATRPLAPRVGLTVRAATCPRGGPLRPHRSGAASLSFVLER